MPLARTLLRSAASWTLLAAYPLAGETLAQTAAQESGPAAAEVSSTTPTGEQPARGSVGDFANGRGMGPGMGTPGYRGTWYPTSDIRGTNSDLGLVRQSLSLAVPVWRGDGQTVLLTTGVRHSWFFTDAILPDTGRPFPEELWNISLGTMYLHRFDNGWSGGLSATFGSASDRPFHSIEEMNLGFFGFLKVPVRNDRDAWMFSIMYSPVGNLTFPIPGLAYQWNPSDELSVSLGLPFLLKWSPVEDLVLTLSYVPITNVNARATYRLTPAFQVFTGFEWLNEAYFLADRADERERFLAFEKRLLGGVRWDLWTHAALELQAGYAFDRYYGEGRNQISNLHDRVDLRPGAFVGANLLVRW